MMRKRLTFIYLVIFITVICGGWAFADSSSDATGDIQFILKPAYKIGEKAEFKIRNIGKVSYSYNQKYPACDFSYFDDAGREFVIPPATHCDQIVTVEIKPGETKKLFDWDLSECVSDNFGCVKSKPLQAGTYTIEGSFVSYTDDDITTESSATIKIIK